MATARAEFMRLGGSMIGHAGVSSDQWGEMSLADEAETDGGNGSAEEQHGVPLGLLYGVHCTRLRKRLARGALGFDKGAFSRF